MPMKILVFASCSKRKAVTHINQLDCSQITSKNQREVYVQQFLGSRPARELYRGALNISINAAVDQMRKKFDISYYIISAGFGILEENWLVPPYECSFSSMRTMEIKERAHKLNIPNDFQKITKKEKPELIYLSLGKKYLESLGDWDKNLPCPTIAFDSSKSEKVITFPADYLTVKEFSSRSGIPIHGIVGFKGDFLKLLANYLIPLKDPEKELRHLIANPEELKYLMNSIRIEKGWTQETLG